jgi:hypothetical protein
MAKQLTKLTSKDGMVAVYWRQEAANGEQAACAINGLIRPHDGLVDAMRAVVPHVQRYLNPGIPPEEVVKQESVLAAFGISERTTKKGVVVKVRFGLDAPKQAMRMTNVGELSDDFAAAIEDLVRKGIEYARLSCAARDAVTA